jgi:hypothetical protein
MTSTRKRVIDKLLIQCVNSRLMQCNCFDIALLQISQVLIQLEDLLKVPIDVQRVNVLKKAQCGIFSLCYLNAQTNRAALCPTCNGRHTNRVISVTVASCLASLSSSYDLSLLNLQMFSFD